MKKALTIVGFVAAVLVAVKVVVANAYGVSPSQVPLFGSGGGFNKP